MNFPILLPNIFNYPFTYKSDQKLIVGDFVEVPFGKTKIIGVVWDNFEKNENKNFKTNQNNIYAIGDVISGPMLAHKAEDEGIAVAENIAGQSGHVNYDTIPGVIYTSPEVASIGKTEEQLKDLKINYKIGKFSFMANSRAKAIDETEGFVKILADEKTDKVLGAHLIGPHAGELIGEIGICLLYTSDAADE